MFVDELLKLLVGPAVFFEFAQLAFVQRRRGKVEIPVFDDGTHTAEEECHKKCGDVRTIDIGIGHDDNLVVCQLGDVGLVRVFFGAYGDAQRSEQVGNFFVLEDFVLHGLLDVEILPRSGSMA